jgi:hypothetical protein
MLRMRVLHQHANSARPRSNRCDTWWREAVPHDADALKHNARLRTPNERHHGVRNHGVK